MQMNDIGFSPSFNCYASDSLTSKAAEKVRREFQDELSDVEEEDFEFSIEFAGEKYSTQELALSGRILLPIFDTDLVTKDEVESEVKEKLDDKTDSDSLIIPLEKLLISETGDPVSYSSEEAEKAEKEDDFEKRASKTFCVSWRKPRHHAAIKKSRSTGSESESGSRKWRITDILRRSNSAGKESVFFLCPQRVEDSNKKRAIKSSEGSKAGGKPKMGSSPSVHELFYMQKREEQKGDKKRSYLPYRQAILGFQVQVNGNANGNRKLPF